jgi:diaminopimelate decarboxylase
MDPYLAHQFGDHLPSYEEYAEAIGRPFSDHYHGDNQPILFTEPGTTLVNKYVSFISTVEAVKHIKGKDFVVLDGSKHNLGELCELKRLPVQIVYSSGRKDLIHHADFVGYTCLEHDVLYKDYSGEIAVGDKIVFDNVGGYSNVSKPPFIKPNVYMISSNGRVIKRAESTEEVMCTYE